MENSNFNEISLLSWGSGQTKEELSYNHSNINFNDENLLSETIQEYDDIMGNTKTESIINDEIGEDDDEIKKSNEIEKELNTNVEVITVDNLDKKDFYAEKENLVIADNKNFTLKFKTNINEKKSNPNDIIIKDIESHELNESQIITDQDVQTIILSLNNENRKQESNGSINDVVNKTFNNNVKIEPTDIKCEYNIYTKANLSSPTNLISSDNDNDNDNKNHNNINENFIISEKKNNDTLIDNINTNTKVDDILNITFNSEDNNAAIDNIDLKKLSISDENKITITGEVESNNKKENAEAFENTNINNKPDDDSIKNENKNMTTNNPVNSEYNKQHSIFENIYFSSQKDNNKDNFDNDYDKNSISFSDEALIDDMKNYDCTFRNNENFHIENKNIDNKKINTQEYSLSILKNIDPKTIEFTDEFENFIKKIDSTLKSGEITINENDQYVEKNLEFNNINEELSMNIEYKNDKKHQHSFIENDYDFNFEYKHSKSKNDTNPPDKEEVKKTEKEVLNEILSLEEYNKIFQDFERKMEIFNKMFEPERIEKIADVINSGIKLISNMCKSKKNKNLSKNKKNKMILNKIINLINSLIPEQNKPKSTKNKEKKVNKNKNNTKSNKIYISNKLQDLKTKIDNYNYKHTFDDEEIFNDLRPPHYNSTEDEIFFVSSKTLLMEWNDYVNQLRKLSKTISKKKYITLIREICYAQYYCCTLAKIIYNYMSFPSAYHLALLAMDYMKAGLYEQSYEYITKSEKLMHYLYAKRKLYNKNYYSKNETDEEYKLRVKETEWTIYNINAHYDLRNHNYEHAHNLIEKSFTRSRMIKKKNNKYLTLISETYKIAIILSTKEKNFCQSTKFVNEWLYYIDDDVDKANISYEYAKLLLKNNHISEETLSFALNSYNLYIKANMKFQIGLSSGLIGKIYHKKNDVYNTQEYMMTSISNITEVVLEDPIFYKEYFSVLYEYEKILMNSYYEMDNYKEAQKFLDKILSKYDYTSYHIYDLEIYQAIVYAYSGYIVKVFKTLKMILENINPNSEQLTRCIKCFDLLFDNHRDQIISYVQRPSKTIRNIISQVFKTENIMNWMNSQILASDSRKSIKKIKRIQ